MKVGSMVGTCGLCGAMSIVKSDLPGGYCPVCGQYSFGKFLPAEKRDAINEDKKQKLGDQYQTAEEFFRDNECDCPPDGHGIYRVADVEALLEFFEAHRVREDGVLNFTLQHEAVERLERALDAITPDLLARCRREPR